MSTTEPIIFDLEPSVAFTAAEAWARCGSADPSHPILMCYHLPRSRVRQIDRYLVLPLRDMVGSVLGLRLVAPGGTEDVWPEAARDLPCILEVDGSATTIIVRGSMVDALAVHAACAVRVVHIPTHGDPYGLRDELKTDHPDEKILVAEPSMAAASLAGSVGEPLVGVVAPPPNMSWEALHAIGGASAVRSWIDDPALLVGGVNASEYLVARSSGLWTSPIEDGVPYRVSGPVFAFAHARDEQGGSWRRAVQLWDRDGKARVVLIPEQDLLLPTRKTISMLISAGLEIADPSLAGLLVRHLATTEVRRRLLIVSQPGWHGSHYVGTGGTFGPSSIELPVTEGQTSRLPAPPPEPLAAWQREIGTLAEGNSRLVIALGIAFGGIAIGLIEGQANIGIHLRGVSSIGKSTALRVAASVYGPPRTEVQTWSATENGLEATATRHHHRALLLDELAQISPVAAVNAAYLLGNGVGKTRAGSTGRAISTQTWTLTFLSSGEIALADKVAERDGAPTLREGQSVRLIDLAGDAGAGHGILECLHGHSSGAVLSEVLNRAAESCKGEVGHAFAAVLARDIERSRSLLVAKRDEFLECHLPADADGIEHRVYGNLAFLAAACEVATDFGILPWRSGGGIEGVSICAREWCASWRSITKPSPCVLARDWLNLSASRLGSWEAAIDEDNTLGYARKMPSYVYLRRAGWQALCGEVHSAQMQAALTEVGAFRYAPARRPKASKVEKFYIINVKALEQYS